MKRIVIVLIMLVTFVGFAINKKNNVNFNYDKFIGYYDEYDDLLYPELQIIKDKKGNYYLLDYGDIGGSIFAHDNTIYLHKLKKYKGKLYNKYGGEFYFSDKKVYNDGYVLKKSNLKKIKKLKRFLKDCRTKFENAY